MRDVGARIRAPWGGAGDPPAVADGRRLSPLCGGDGELPHVLRRVRRDVQQRVERDPAPALSHRLRRVHGRVERRRAPGDDVAGGQRRRERRADGGTVVRSRELSVAVARSRIAEDDAAQPEVRRLRKRGTRSGRPSMRPSPSARRAAAKGGAAAGPAGSGGVRTGRGRGCLTCAQGRRRLGRLSRTVQPVKHPAADGTPLTPYSRRIVSDRLTFDA